MKHPLMLIICISPPYFHINFQPFFYLSWSCVAALGDDRRWCARRNFSSLFPLRSEQVEKWTKKIIIESTLDRLVFQHHIWTDTNTLKNVSLEIVEAFLSPRLSRCATRRKKKKRLSVSSVLCVDSVLVWKMLKWFSVYIGLSEGIELITEDQRAEE